MKTEDDWKKRAMELAVPVREIGGAHVHFDPWMNVERALQLGREMAAEACEQGVVEFRCRLAADRRAEEIARAIEKASRVCADGPTGFHFMPDGATIARATITKPKEPHFMGCPLPYDKNLEHPQTEGMIRADEREKIAQRLLEDGAGPEWIERMTGAKPKTREQVLEDALREIERGYGDPAKDIARRALEWKP